MKTFRLARCAVALLALTLASCSRGKNPVIPTTHTITGPVKLTGYLVNANSGFVGTKVVGDADGVRVQLMYGSILVAETLTEHGIYRFSGIGSGGYVARTRIIAGVSDVTETITVADYDVVVTDTLRLVSRGDLHPVPNPIESLTAVYYEVPETTQVDIRVLDLSGNLVRALVTREALPRLLNVVFWDGRNSSGQLAPGDIFWMVFKAGFDERAHLLFR